MLVEQRLGLFDKQVREAQDSNAVSRNPDVVREPSDANVHTVLEPVPRGFVSQPVRPGNGLRARVSERGSYKTASKQQTYLAYLDAALEVVGWKPMLPVRQSLFGFLLLLGVGGARYCFGTTTSSAAGLS